MADGMMSVEMMSAASAVPFLHQQGVGGVWSQNVMLETAQAMAAAAYFARFVWWTMLICLFGSLSLRRIYKHNI